MTAGSDPTQALLDAALLFGSTRDLQRLSELVLQRLVSLVGAERALFGVFNYQGEIEHAETHNIAWGGVGSPLPISNRTIDEVRRSQEIRHVADAANADLNVHESIRLHNLRFVLAVPVRACDRVAGVLYADSSLPAPEVAERQTQLVRGLAMYVGLALENVLLLQEQRMRAAMLDQLVHDLRTPLQVVSTNAQWLYEGEASEAELRETARDLQISSLKMKRMIDVTRRLSLLEGGAVDGRPAAVDVAETLVTHARVQRLVAREYHLAFEVDAPDALPPVITYADRLDLVLDNLVFNALKHARTGTTIHLSARMRRDAGPAEAVQRPLGEGAVLFQKVPAVVADATKGWVEVTVANEGAAIAPEVFARLFQPGAHDGETRRGEASSGLGLSIVHQGVHSLGGAVWAETGSFGTRMFFSLPLLPKTTTLRPSSRFPTGSVRGA